MVCVYAQIKQRQRFQEAGWKDDKKKRLAVFALSKKLQLWYMQLIISFNFPCFLGDKWHTYILVDYTFSKFSFYIFIYM